MSSRHGRLHHTAHGLLNFSHKLKYNRLWKESAPVQGWEGEGPWFLNSTVPRNTNEDWVQHYDWFKINFPSSKTYNWKNQLSAKYFWIASLSLNHLTDCVIIIRVGDAAGWVNAPEQLLTWEAKAAATWAPLSFSSKSLLLFLCWVLWF